MFYFYSPNPSDISQLCNFFKKQKAPSEATEKLFHYGAILAVAVGIASFL